jgi:hypothetical protein
MAASAARLQHLQDVLLSAGHPLTAASAAVRGQPLPRCSSVQPVSAAGEQVDLEPTPAQRFLFDTQGYLLLPEVLTQVEVARLLVRLRELESADYPDTWVEGLGLERTKVALTKQSSSADYQGADHQTRLNGLPKIDPTGTFDPLIAHPRVLPFLRSFMEGPQLVNIWSISKSRGSAGGGFHAGGEPHDYQVDTRRQIRSKMINVIWMLTDNCPGDGEMVLLPGSHKANFPAEDLLVLDGERLPVERVPGAVAVHAEAGSVLIMSECTKHSGLPKTTDGIRSNLYFNHVEHRASPRSAVYNR